jgi:hypothetical protein
MELLFVDMVIKRRGVKWVNIKCLGKQETHKIWGEKNHLEDLFIVTGTWSTGL